MIYKSIDEIADVTKLAGFEFTKHIKYIEDGEIIALRALNLRDGHLDLKDIKRIDKSVSEQLTRSKLYKNDIVISYTGTIGECAQIHENNKYHLAPNVAKITPNPIFVNPQYLFYYIGSSMFRNQMYNYCHGSTQPTIPMKIIRELSIPIFPLETQYRIASILSALDDKIELNNKINENLEMQAQAIFKSWFVDFEPFGGVMPEDWKMGNLLDIADYLNGLAMQKFKPNDNENSLPVLKIKELRQGFCDNTSDLCSKNIKNEYIIHDGDVIFSWSGSLLVDFWCGGICGLNQHLFKVSSRKYDKWFYYSWTQYHLQKFISIAKDMATTMGHIKREELKKSEVLIPNNEDYLKLDGLLSPIYNKIIINRIENKRLAELRDTLLPKLMNGEIDVDDVQVKE